MRRYAEGMRAILTFFVMLLGASLGFAENPAIAPGLAVLDMEQIAPGVYVKQLAPEVWVDTFIGKADGAPYAANGLLLISGDSSVLVDPGWASDQTKALLAFATDRLKHPVKKAVITHWHEDRAAGIAVFPVPQATSKTRIPGAIGSLPMNASAPPAMVFATTPKSPAIHVARIDSLIFRISTGCANIP